MPAVACDRLPMIKGHASKATDEPQYAQHGDDLSNCRTSVSCSRERRRLAWLRAVIVQEPASTGQQGVGLGDGAHGQSSKIMEPGSRPVRM